MYSFNEIQLINKDILTHVNMDLLDLILTERKKKKTQKVQTS